MGGGGAAVIIAGTTRGMATIGGIIRGMGIIIGAVVVISGVMKGQVHTILNGMLIVEIGMGPMDPIVGIILTNGPKVAPRRDQTHHNPPIGAINLPPLQDLNP